MADQSFFTRLGPFSLADIAASCGAELQSGDSAHMVHDVGALDQAGADQISFLDNIKYRDAFRASKAGACFVAPQMVEFAPAGMALLVSKNPYKAYALCAQKFYPESYPDARISPRAHIDPSASIGAGCVIDDGAVVQAGATIGDGSWIEANAVIGRNVTMGQKCRVGAGATVTHCVIGNAVRLYPGVRIGQDGFGFAIDPAGHVKVPQLGRVVIEDRVEIGANTCIDRGAGPDTVIGAGTWIDNLVQIGHNVKIGRGCVIVSQVGVSGSTVLEDYVVLAGQVGVAGHLRIGRGARIAAQSGLMRDVPAGEEQMGSPALPIKQYMRQIAMLNRLIKKQK